MFRRTLRKTVPYAEEHYHESARKHSRIFETKLIVFDFYTGLKKFTLDYNVNKTNKMAKKSTNTATAAPVAATPAKTAKATKNAAASTNETKSAKPAKSTAAAKTTTKAGGKTAKKAAVTAEPAEVPAKAAKTTNKKSVKTAVAETPAPKATRTRAAKKADAAEPAPVVEEAVAPAKPAKKSRATKKAAVVEETPAAPAAAAEETDVADSADLPDDADDDSNSVFNKNAVKRLVCIAGIPRTGNDVADRVNSLITNWIDTVLDKVTSYLEFTGHKTLNVGDLQFLSERYPKLITPFLAPSSFSVSSCKKTSDLEKVLKGKQHGSVFTAKRTFDAFVHERLASVHAATGGPAIRLGNNDKNNTVVLLQLLAEEFAVNVFSQARLRMDKRDTLTAADIDAVVA